MSQTMGIQWHRGTEWALQPGARVSRRGASTAPTQQMWVCPNEQYRLMYVGAGSVAEPRFLHRVRREIRRGIRALELPVDRLRWLPALRHARSAALSGQPLHDACPSRCTFPGLGGAWAIWEARRHRVDGGLSLGGWWGQRIINVALEENGIPVLDFPVDPVDANTWDDMKMRALVSDFIETRLAPARSGA